MVRRRLAEVASRGLEWNGRWVSNWSERHLAEAATAVSTTTVPGSNSDGERLASSRPSANGWHGGGSGWEWNWGTWHSSDWAAGRGGSWANGRTAGGPAPMSPSSLGAATGRTTSQPTTRDGGSGSCSTADRYCEEARFAGGGVKGPSEKLLVPTFSGEGDGGELGASARSYLRQVAAWERMTKLSRSQRALVLYQHLAGAAWVNAESLEMERLGSEGGVDYLREWVQQHYLDVEVTQIGRSLSDLFRKLKRRPTQTFRDYVAEYNRLLARVTECGCRLPDTACAWLFVDRAALDEGTEVSLLASVGNKYDLRLLQQAAIILDRSSRKPWERTSRAEPYRKHQTVHPTEDTMADEGASDSDGPPLHDDVDDDGEGLYVAYMTAKAKYKDHGKARGVDVEAVKRTAEARIQAAKAKSFCAACGQRGHWHKDAACPKRRHEDGQGGDVRTAKPQTIHIANEVFELRVDAGKSPLLAITDSACSRSVMGTAWFQRYLDMAGGSGREVELIQERESFRFGASRVYESSFAAVVMIPFGSSWVAVRAAVVHGDMPLLLSRPLLASLGMVMDLATNRASFKAVDLMDYQLLTTETGHPAVPVDHSGRALPDLTRLPKSWGPDGVAVIGPQGAYMVAQACGAGDYGGIRTGPALPGNGVGRIFYEKRIDPAVKNMLLADFLNHEAFLNWWCTSSVGNDFWIEHPERLVRVHVIPRKSFFDPRKWQTQYGLQRDLLLQSLGDLRETWGISCSSQRALSTVCECWRGQESVSTGYPTLWIGRSLFSRATLPERISVGPAPGGHGRQGNMENEQGRAPVGVLPPADPDKSRLDCPGAEDNPCQRQEDEHVGEGRGAQEVDHDDVGGAPCNRLGDGIGGREDGEQGRHHAPHSRPRGPRLNGPHAGSFQGLPVHRDSRDIRGVGIGGGKAERRQHAPRPQAVRGVEEESTSNGRGNLCSVEDLRLRGACEDPSTADLGNRLYLLSLDDGVRTGQALPARMRRRRQSGGRGPVVRNAWSKRFRTMSGRRSPSWRPSLLR